MSDMSGDGGDTHTRSPPRSGNHRSSGHNGYNNHHSYDGHGHRQQGYPPRGHGPPPQLHRYPPQPQPVHYVQQPVVVGQLRPVYSQPAVVVAQPMVYQPSQVWAPETPEQQLKNRVRRSKNVALSFLISFAALSGAFLISSALDIAFFVHAKWLMIPGILLGTSGLISCGFGLYAHMHLSYQHIRRYYYSGFVVSVISIVSTLLISILLLAGAIPTPCTRDEDDVSSDSGTPENSCNRDKNDENFAKLSVIVGMSIWTIFVCGITVNTRVYAKRVLEAVTEIGTDGELPNAQNQQRYSPGEAVAAALDDPPAESGEARGDHRSQDSTAV